MELTKAEFEREIERHRVRHDRWTNYGILAIVSLLFLVSVAVLSVIAYQVNNHNTLRDKAITLLAPLTGLALGFLSGKIKWPAL
jgi:archaellum biogenesis protein FlaJ (TadC family)